MWHDAEIKLLNVKIIRNLTDAYLQHDGTDVPHTLSDGLWSARDCDSSFRWVWQHVSSHLNLSTGGLNIAIRREKKQKKQRLFCATNPTRSPLLKCCFKQPQITPNTFWHAESSCKPNRNACSKNFKRCTQILSIQRTYACSLCWSFDDNHWDYFSSSRENPHKHILQEKINKRSLTGVFDTCCFTTPK